MSIKAAAALVAALAAAAPCRAEDHHLRSVTGAATSACDGTDHYFKFPPVPPGRPGGGGRVGAGRWPLGAFLIVGVEIVAITDDPNSYAVLGGTQPDGDYISRRVQGAGALDRMFPAGSAFLFPNDGRAELHLHVLCHAGRQHVALVTIFLYQ